MFKGWLNFSGRIGRKEYFRRCLYASLFALFGCALYLLLLIFYQKNSLASYFIAFTLPLLVLYIFLCINAKRFHDINSSGWCQFPLFIPHAIQALLLFPVFLPALRSSYIIILLLLLVSAILLLLVIFKKGTQGTNRFGEDPLSQSTARSGSFKSLGITIAAIMFALAIMILIIFPKAKAPLLISYAENIILTRKLSNTSMNSNDVKTLFFLYTQAIKDNPQIGSAYVGRARLLLMAKMTDAAFADINSALKLNEDSAELRTIRGQIFMTKKATQIAIADFNKALSMDPAKIEVYGYLGKAYESIEDFPNAIEAFKQYLALGPPSPQLVAEVKRRIELNEQRVSIGKPLPPAQPNPQSITSADRDMIRALLPYFSAINAKDYANMKRINLGMRDTSVSNIAQGINTINSYTFHGVENAAYHGDKLVGTILYTVDTASPNQMGQKTLSPFITDVVLIKEEKDWLISTWIPYEVGTGFTGKRDMNYFLVVLDHIENAEKRFGVKDVSKWPGL